jgi:hypothetical protein
MGKFACQCVLRLLGKRSHGESLDEANVVNSIFSFCHKLRKIRKNLSSSNRKIFRLSLGIEWTLLYRAFGLKLQLLARSYYLPS